MLLRFVKMGNSMNGCLRAAGMAENMPPRDMLDMPDEIDFPTDDGTVCTKATSPDDGVFPHPVNSCTGVAEVPDLPDVQELPAGISSTADATVNKVDTEPTAVVAAEIYSPLGPTGSSMSELLIQCIYLIHVRYRRKSDASRFERTLWSRQRNTD